MTVNLVSIYPSHDAQLFGQAFVCFLDVFFKDEIRIYYLSACLEEQLTGMGPIPADEGLG